MSFLELPSTGSRSIASPIIASIGTSIAPWPTGDGKGAARVATVTPNVRFHAAGTEIYAQGEPCRNLYEVEFGAVRVYRLLADGRRQISAFHLAGERFGFEADDIHHFFAEAVGATRIRHISMSGDDRARELLPMALRGLVRAQEHLLVLGRQSAIERIAAFLTDMAERQGGLKSFDLPMSRADIADYLGLTIETVSRVFSRLKQKGMIRLPNLRRVEIVKSQMLHNLAA